MASSGVGAGWPRQHHFWVGAESDPPRPFSSSASFPDAAACPGSLDCALKRRARCPPGAHVCGPCLQPFQEDRQGLCVPRMRQPLGMAPCPPVHLLPSSALGGPAPCGMPGLASLPPSGLVALSRWHQCGVGQWAGAWGSHPSQGHQYPAGSARVTPGETRSAFPRPESPQSQAATSPPPELPLLFAQGPFSLHHALVLSA